MDRHRRVRGRERPARSRSAPWRPCRRTAPSRPAGRCPSRPSTAPRRARACAAASRPGADSGPSASLTPRSSTDGTITMSLASIGVDRPLHLDRHAAGQLERARPIRPRSRRGTAAGLRVRLAHQRGRVHHVVDAGQRGDHRIGQRQQARRDARRVVMRDAGRVEWVWAWRNSSRWHERTGLGRFQLCRETARVATMGALFNPHHLRERHPHHEDSTSPPGAPSAAS